MYIARLQTNIHIRINKTVGLKGHLGILLFIYFYDNIISKKKSKMAMDVYLFLRPYS